MFYNVFIICQGPVTFKIVLPNMPDKAEWKLGGQTLEITVPLEDPVSVIKAKLHEVTNMPTGKQKLNWEVSASIFLFMFSFIII